MTNYYTQMVHARGREEIALQANEDANREIARLTKLVQQITLAVNACCTCGGGGPGEKHTCAACDVYHALTPFLPNNKISDPRPLRCADCGGPIGKDIGPSDGWQLEDGRTVCEGCCADDLKRVVRRVRRTTI
ncbi:MAG: hypothetical protein O2960_26035 [Verrucomicrobia bacterium]|nr:hypothetical protein [Verrucomicrobiota bacterium]